MTIDLALPIGLLVQKSPIRHFNRLLPLLLVVLLFPLTPAAAQVQLESDLTLDLTVAPGGSYIGPLILRNVGEEAATVRIYQSDYRFNSAGETFFEEPGALPRSNSNWIELPSTLLTIPPKQVLTLSYSVGVPDDPDLSGSYWSLIFVESVPEGRTETSQGGFGLRQLVRYGIQVMTTVGQTGQVELVFTNPTLQRVDTEGMAFSVDVENTGERFVRPAFQLDLYGRDGMQVGRFGAPKTRIYPGTGVRPIFDLSEVSPGSYNAIFVADAGGENVFGASYNLEIEAP